MNLLDVAMVRSLSSTPIALAPIALAPNAPLQHPDLDAYAHEISGVPVDERICQFQARFDTLDLAPIVARAFGPQAVQLEFMGSLLRDYRDFLCLLALYPMLPLEPTPILDAIWHEHILHTCRYRNDCFALCGRFIDHQPWGEAERQAKVHGKTGSHPSLSQLFRRHFKREPISVLPLPQWRMEGPGACSRGVA